MEPTLPQETQTSIVMYCFEPKCPGKFEAKTKEDLKYRMIAHYQLEHGDKCDN